ncbi:ABC transporter permease [Microbulbifer elongatus]|uniref:ABC transporter permease n=1 Tax=Microbulbifer elongatus TaxID=86173 RepID=UPI001E3A78A1|nr:ABC transporter permease [Microbulbifer elongatus]
MPLISLRDIRKHYGGYGEAPKVEVLRGIDLDIDRGEFVSIVGASGSGKSTLMHIIGCLDTPTSGEYLFEHEDVASLSRDQLARLRSKVFGFVFQAYHLIPTESARENVEVPAIYAGIDEVTRQARAIQLLSGLGLGERLDHRPSQLSGGQQQRVSIARALINGGTVILADEPTGALDRESGDQVMTLLRGFAAEGHTVVLITHDQQVAASADRIIEIQDGRIVRDMRNPRMKHVQDAAVARTDTGYETSLGSTPIHPPGRALGRLLPGVTDACRAAWRVLNTNRARTLLTLLGIIIGVASVVTMLAVGEGAKREVMSRLNAMGSNLLQIGSSRPKSGGPRGVITEEDIEAIAKIPEVRRVMPILRDDALVRFGSFSRNFEVLAPTEVMPEVNRWPVLHGRFFTREENRNVAPVVVLGYRAYQYYFPDAGNPLGHQILIKDAPYEIIGVMSEKASESGHINHDERLYVPRRTGMVRVFPDQRDESYLVVEVVNSEQLYRAQENIETLLLARHGRADFWLNNAAARQQTELEARNSLTMMLALIAAISLLVGGIGVMNVMLMTVRERVREIGIRLASGARQRDIHRQFIVEATLVSLVGGGTGILLSVVVIAALALLEVPVAPSLNALLGAVACAVITGVVFGLMPARQAARLHPVAALNRE